MLPLLPSVDALLSDSNVVIQDMELLHKFPLPQELTGEAKKLVNHFFDMVIRDHVTSKTYANK